MSQFIRRSPPAISPQRSTTSRASRSPGPISPARCSVDVRVRRRPLLRLRGDPVGQHAGEQEERQHDDPRVAEPGGAVQAGGHRRLREADERRLDRPDPAALEQQAGGLGDLGVGVGVGRAAPDQHHGGLAPLLARDDGLEPLARGPRAAAGAGRAAGRSGTTGRGGAAARARAPRGCRPCCARRRRARAARRRWCGGRPRRGAPPRPGSAAARAPGSRPRRRRAARPWPPAPRARRTARSPAALFVPCPTTSSAGRTSDLRVEQGVEGRGGDGRAPLLAAVGHLRQPGRAQRRLGLRRADEADRQADDERRARRRGRAARTAPSARSRRPRPRPARPRRTPSARRRRERVRPVLRAGLAHPADDVAAGDAGGDHLHVGDDRRAGGQRAPAGLERVLVGDQVGRRSRGRRWRARPAR